MRNWIGAAAFAMIAVAVAAAPAKKRAGLTLAQAREAIAKAGPPASDAEVARAYPRFMLHPGHGPRTWFVTKTDQGCLYYGLTEELDASEDPARNVVEMARDISNVRWTGSPCTPGQFITGQGTLSYVDTGLRNTGRIERIEYTETGRMVNGVWQGMVDPAMRYLAPGNTSTGMKPGEYFGGCTNLSPRYVIKGALMCQPRLP